MNQLILGDCLEVMRKMDSESVDLIYLDPPFFSNRNYEVIWGDKGEVRSFEDRWSGGIDHYIAWLKDRVVEMHRLLKPTGSIYLHCDWHADAYIRVHILDKIFGDNNFKSHIIWERTFNSGSSKSIVKNKYPANTDSILYYTKSNNFTFNVQTRPINEAALKRYDKIDSEGRRFKWNPLKTVSPERLERLLSESEAMIIPTSKYPVYKHYLDIEKGVPINNLWNDIGHIAPQNSKERIGYPTQKPEKLLERIIQASSNEGDIVLDPFVGGGTTVVVADKLKRNWLGIDQSVQAIKVSEFRLNKQQDLFSSPFAVQLHKYDYDKIFKQDPKTFETLIVERFGGRPNFKRGSDKGIDGKMQDGTPIQVKQSESVSSMPIRQLVTDAKASDRNLFEKNQQSGNPIAYFIAFSFGKGAVQEVARLKNEENVIIKLVTVEEIIPIAKKPKLRVTIKDLTDSTKTSEESPSNKRGQGGVLLREIQFTATAESSAGIEMFAWDWDYQEDKPFKAEVILDKNGTQTMKFKPGNHTIAVKVVDNDGLEAIEIIKLKVNGVVERE